MQSTSNTDVVGTHDLVLRVTINGISEDFDFQVVLTACELKKFGAASNTPNTSFFATRGDVIDIGAY